MNNDLQSLKLAHNIGTESHSNYHTRDQILRCEDPIGFDGIYRNVYENQDVLEGKTGIFFVVGDYVGLDNEFDLDNVPKLEEFCTWREIDEMVEKFNFKIGWHTWSHPDLTKLGKEEIMEEITPPFPMKYLAYPYGKFNDLVIECAKEAGYEMAWSVTQGNDNIYSLYRNYI